MQSVQNDLNTDRTNNTNSLNQGKQVGRVSFRNAIQYANIFSFVGLSQQYITKFMNTIQCWRHRNISCGVVFIFWPEVPRKSDHISSAESPRLVRSPSVRWLQDLVIQEIAITTIAFQKAETFRLKQAGLHNCIYA